MHSLGDRGGGPLHPFVGRGIAHPEDQRGTRRERLAVALKQRRRVAEDEDMVELAASDAVDAAADELVKGALPLGRQLDLDGDLGAIGVMPQDVGNLLC